VIDDVEEFNKAFEAASVEAVIEGRATFGQQLIAGRILKKYLENNGYKVVKDE